MSTNKAPRSSRGSLRAKAGLPAKAGRRKVYGPNSKRKVKDWASMGTGYVMNSMDTGPSPYSHTVCADEWRTGQPVVHSRSATFRQESNRLTETEMANRKAALEREGLM